jgi:hypothetical protein
VSRRILVRVSQSGEITVKAEGFKGNGCEAATKAIEAALGKSRGRTRKADFWKQANTGRNQQRIGGS